MKVKQRESGEPVVSGFGGIWYVSNDKNASPTSCGQDEDEVDSSKFQY